MKGQPPVFNKLKRVLASIAVMVLGAVGALVVAETPAHASYSTCYFICAYTDAGGGGSQWTLPAYLNSCQSVPAGWNDVISSAYNTGQNWRVVFYTEAGCWGGAKTFWPGNLGDMWPMNDAASSWKIFT